MAAIHEGREYGVDDFVLLEPINMDVSLVPKPCTEREGRRGRVPTQ